MKLRSLELLLLILFNACDRETAIPSFTYAQVAKGKCSADTLNAYHFIQPENHTGLMPLLIILDSGGDGLFALKKIKPAISRIPCVVIGSDLVRNNYPGYEQAINVLIKEAQNKFPVSKNQVFIAGFSGGARMAFEYACMHLVQGVLMCGAGPDRTSFQDLPCPVYMIAGTTDFNFSEIFDNPLKSTGHSRFMADYFRGSHEWPPVENLKEGLLSLMAKSVPEGQELLKQESKFLSAKTDSLLRRDETLFAVKSVEKSIHFDLHNKTARKKMQKIRTNLKVARDLKNIESDLEMEVRIKQKLINASMEEDSIWWGNQIQQLTQEIDNNIGEAKDHWLRIKGFMGILFFTQLNNMISTQPGNNRISDLLAAYRMAEPGNPDVYYYYALYALKQGKEQDCRQNLSLAFSLGFKDREKAEKDFPQAMVNFIR